MINQIILAQDSATSTEATRSVWEAISKTFADVWKEVDIYFFAILIFIAGLVIAKYAAKLVEKWLQKTNIDNKIAEYLGFEGGAGTESVISKFFKYLIWLIAFIMALNVAELGSDVTGPFSDLLSQFLGAIDNILKAGLLVLFTIVIAKVVKAVLGKVLDIAKLDERIGTGDGKPVAHALCTIAYWLIILMLLPSIFTALDLPNVTDSILNITEQITSYLPHIIGGVIIIAVGYLLGSIAQKIIFSLLNAVGFDKFPSKIGYEGEIKSDGAKSPSGIVSYIVMVSIIVMASAQAFTTMNLESISSMAKEFQDGFFSILGGVIILGIGIFVANWVAGLLDDRSDTLAKIARTAIIIFAAAMAISQANIAPEISETLFIAIIIAGAFALGVGGAIALGLGGRERVKEFMDKLGK